MKKVVKYFVGFWLLMLLIVEWLAELILKLWTQVHNSLKELTGALQEIYKEINIKKVEPDSGNVSEKGGG